MNKPPPHHAIRKTDRHGRAVTIPRTVNLLHGDDFKCALLGSLGFSTRLIMHHTGFTPSQIGYRLRKGDIRRSDYRNGESSVAENLLQRARTVAVPALKQHLRTVISSD